MACCGLLLKLEHHLLQLVHLRLQVIQCGICGSAARRRLSRCGRLRQTWQAKGSGSRKQNSEPKVTAEAVFRLRPRTARSRQDSAGEGEMQECFSGDVHHSHLSATILSG